MTGFALELELCSLPCMTKINIFCLISVMSLDWVSIWPLTSESRILASCSRVKVTWSCLPAECRGQYTGTALNRASEESLDQRNNLYSSPVLTFTCTTSVSGQWGRLDLTSRVELATLLKYLGQYSMIWCMHLNTFYVKIMYQAAQYFSKFIWWIIGLLMLELYSVQSYQSNSNSGCSLLNQRFCKPIVPNHPTQILLLIVLYMLFEIELEFSLLDGLWLFLSPTINVCVSLRSAWEYQTMEEWWACCYMG